MPPYRFGRDPITERLDEYLAEPGNVLEMLTQLRRDPDGETTFASDLLRDGDRTHLFNDTYAEAPDLLPGEDLVAVQARGRRRKDVYRAGVRAALELALGIGRNDAAPATAVRAAPIDTYWGCGAPFNQAWVGWNTRAGERRVTLILLSDRQPMGWDDDLVQPVPDFPPSDPDDSGLAVIQDKGGELNPAVMFRPPTPR